MRSAIANQIEAVLFVAEKPVSRGELAKIVGATPKQTDAALAELAQGYAGRAASHATVDQGARRAPDDNR